MNRKNMTYQSVFLLLIFLAFNLTTHAGGPANEYYHQLDYLTIKQLFEKGQTYYQQGKSDSALICFSMCGNRNANEVSREEKKLCVRALVESSQLYFLFYDYGKASSQLLKALKLSREYELEEETPKIYVEQAHA